MLNSCGFFFLYFYHSPPDCFGAVPDGLCHIVFCFWCGILERRSSKTGMFLRANRNSRRLCGPLRSGFILWRTKVQRHRRKEASGDNGRFQEKHRTEFIDSTEFNVMKYLGMTDIFFKFLRGPWTTRRTTPPIIGKSK